MWNLRTAESAQAVFAITLVCALVFLSAVIPAWTRCDRIACAAQEAEASRLIYFCSWGCGQKALGRKRSGFLLSLSAQRDSHLRVEPRTLPHGSAFCALCAQHSSYEIRGFSAIC